MQRGCEMSAAGTLRVRRFSDSRQAINYSLKSKTLFTFELTLIHRICVDSQRTCFNLKVLHRFKTFASV